MYLVLTEGLLPLRLYAETPGVFDLLALLFTVLLESAELVSSRVVLPFDAAAPVSTWEYLEDQRTLSQASWPASTDVDDGFKASSEVATHHSQVRA